MRSFFHYGRFSEVVFITTLRAEIHRAGKSGVLTAAVALRFVWPRKVNSTNWVNKGKVQATKNLAIGSFTVTLAVPLEPELQRGDRDKGKKVPKTEEATVSTLFTDLVSITLLLG